MQQKLCSPLRCPTDISGYCPFPLLSFSPTNHWQQMLAAKSSPSSQPRQEVLGAEMSSCWPSASKALHLASSAIKISNNIEGRSLYVSVSPQATPASQDCKARRALRAHRGWVRRDRQDLLGSQDLRDHQVRG